MGPLDRKPLNRRPSLALLYGALAGAILFAQTAHLPVGYDTPASDQGGPRLKSGLHWIDRVSTQPVFFALARREPSLASAPEPPWEPPTVMFITNYGGVDTVLELNRRFAMDVLHFWGDDLTDRGRFYRLLNSREHIDCFVMSRFKTKSMPPEIQYEILKRVSKGTGFVMIDDFDRSPTLNPKFLELKPTTKGRRVFPGIPYDGLRQWVHADVLDLPIMNYWNTKSLPQAAEVKPFDSWDVSISPFGKGTIVWISTGTHWARAGRSGRTLLPQINQRRDMWAETDYYYSHTAKAIMRAANIPQAARLREIVMSPKPTLVVESTDAFEARIEWQVRDTWGVVLLERMFFLHELVPGEQRIPLQEFEHWYAGRCFVDVWLKTPDWETIDWGSAFTFIDRGVAPCKLTADHPEGTPRGQPLTGSVAVPDVPDGTHLQLSLWDRHWREVARSRRPVKSGESTPFHFPTDGLDGQIWDVHADLITLEEKLISSFLSHAFLTVTSPHTRATRGAFLPLMTCVGATNPEEAARAEYLRQLGFLANRPYSGGNRIMAESLAWRDIQLFPFSFRLTGASDDFNHDTITDWSDPGVRKQLADVHRAMTRIYKPFGLRGYNLSDDSAASSQLPLGPYTTIEFHRWLEKEYGGLMETARAWGLKTTGFGRIHSWGRIHQKSVKAWYDKGITAPWIDAQRFLEKHWVDSMVHVRDAVREVLPDANVGSDASYYKNATSDLFGRLDYLAPYYRDVVVKVAVARGAARRPGDYGACLGSYGDKPERMTGRRGQIWDVLFAGGTGFYYWSFHVGLREDRTLDDAHALYQCEVVEEIMNGIGELFARADRVFDPVAILDSQTSGICDQLEQKGEPLTSKANSLGAFLHAMEDLGLNSHIITGDELAAGWLAENGIRLLLLPGCNSLSDEEIAAIRAFAQAGGIVAADVRPAARYPNGNPRQKAPLDDLFGVKVNAKEKRPRAKGDLTGTALGAGEPMDFGLTLCDPRLVPEGADVFAELQPNETARAAFAPAAAIFVNRCGEGRAVLLNASFSSYDTYRSEGGAVWEPWFRVMSAVAGIAELKPLFRGTSRGKETPGLEFSPFRNGEGWLLGVEDLGCGDDTSVRRPFEVRLPGEFHLYDVRAGRYLGRAGTLEDTIPRGGHRAYALLPYEVTAVEVQADRATVRAGETGRLTVRIRTDGGKPSGHVVRVLAPCDPFRDIPPFFPLKRVLPVAAGKQLTVPVRFAWGEYGDWPFAVTDVGTGVTGTVELTVDGNAE